MVTEELEGGFFMQVAIFWMEAGYTPESGSTRSKLPQLKKDLVLSRCFLTSTSVAILGFKGLELGALYAWRCGA